MKQVRNSTVGVAVAMIGVLLLGFPNVALSQENTWMTAGSLHNWFSAIGCEIEVGRSPDADQQDGLQWPAYYPYQDMQAAKALWIAAAAFRDEAGSFWPHKVEHVGPRVRGTGEFFPVKFELISRFSFPEVFVDEVPSIGKLDPANIKRIDPTMSPDMMIDNVVNCKLGITMHRTIMQWSQPFHDNYMVYDYKFINTGNTNGDAAIELPNQTLDSVYFFFQYRYAVNADVRYVVANSSGWGINSMLDTRGDGWTPPVVDQYENFRAQFIWHGRHPSAAPASSIPGYDNIGAPIPIGYYDKADTNFRLGGAQMCGLVTLHADSSTTIRADAVSQPRTTSWEGSDAPRTSNNSDRDIGNMDDEWLTWITRGHRTPRHAWVVEPAGKFNEPTGDPAQGTPGGFSNTNGYGPYRMAFGDTVHIIMAEGANGLSREACLRIGKKYKNQLKNLPGDKIDSKAKNDSVFTSKDSLFLTFGRAMANMNSGYTIPRSPLPPKTFSVSSGDPVALTWDVYTDPGPAVTAFRIYRAMGKYDGTYELLGEVSGSARAFNDTSAIRGVAYYYYIEAVGSASDNNGVGNTPSGALVSNRIWSQTYDPSYRQLSRPPGSTMEAIRVVPNPFSISSDETFLRFSEEPDKIAFFDIPGRCKIRIYTELGELIKEIDHTNGKGDEYWRCTTSSNQVIVSGIYIIVFEDMDTGERAIRKLAVIR